MEIDVADHELPSLSWTFHSSLAAFITSMPQPSDLSLRLSLKSEHRKAFYEGHKDIAVVMILVVFLFPIFGVYVSGLLGAALGMVVSIGAYYLTPFVLFKLGA